MKLLVVFYCLLGIVFIVFLWSLFKYDASHRSKKIARIIIPIVILVVIGGLFTIVYYQKKLNNEKLDVVLNAINIHSYSNRLFKDNKEKILLLDSLYYYYNRIDSIAYNDSIYSYLIGDDVRMRKTLINTLNALKEQIKRYERLNDLLPEHMVYHNEELDFENIHLIEPNTLELDNLNIAFKLKKDDIKPLAVYVQILKKHSSTPIVLYSQYYQSQIGLNSFIIPNYKDDDVLIKLGYIISQYDTLIYRYQIYEKHDSTEYE